MRRFPSSNNNNKMLLYGMLAAAALIVSLSGTALATDDEPLRCYQCRVEKNEDCTDEYLRECPTDQAYDVCMVSVINNAGHVYIEKKCALGPCSLRDPKQSDGLGLDKCDRSQNSYSCFECCKGSGCNRSPATRRRPAPYLVLILSSVLIVTMFRVAQNDLILGISLDARS
ncbi:uncharacterized protein LOC111252002 isoform X2 [Varroa destructor]|uniref:Uncharacterized protein n=1 Tax=Varroa destructor TaxID=109461 RepID=A0A7M7KFE2_VARDE|nr:uncharacterized protein LOC111252002 isoform X2 [Varroa destructor]